jgi:hypothetical protein
VLAGAHPVRFVQVNAHRAALVDTGGPTRSGRGWRTGTSHAILGGGVSGAGATSRVLHHSVATDRDYGAAMTAVLAAVIEALVSWLLPAPGSRSELRDARNRLVRETQILANLDADSEEYRT